MIDRESEKIVVPIEKDSGDGEHEKERGERRGGEGGGERETERERITEEEE